MSYDIRRMYFDSHMESDVIKTGLTLEEAQEHCKDPETSSSTCTDEENVLRTKAYGPWFDGYGEE